MSAKPTLGEIMAFDAGQADAKITIEELKAELSTWQSTARELVKERDGVVKERDLAINHILSIPSNGFHFHVRKEGDAFKQLKEHFMEKARESCK